MPKTVNQKMAVLSPQALQLVQLEVVVMVEVEVSSPDQRLKQLKKTLAVTRVIYSLH